MKSTSAALGSWQKITRLFLGVLALASVVPSTMAQNSTGRVIGTITDAQGALVAKAKVTVTNGGTNVHWETTTAADGTYQVLDLPIGDYTVTVEARGFSKMVTKPQTLNINQSLRIDVALKVGGINEVIEVQSESTQVETVNPTVGGTVTGAPIQDLPLNGRNVLDLALTQPGVTPAQPNVLGAAAGVPSGEFAVAGGRDDSVTYLLDGGDNTSVTYGAPVVNPNPDTVAEFRILANNYTAEYGRSAGGVVSVVTKSGTNQLHGSVFDYLRNDALNANNYFNNESGLARPILKRNQFGGTLGGPIVKDRAFFFFGYQGQRQNSITVGNVIPVYTTAELQGDFSQAAGGAPDPGVACFLTGTQPSAPFDIAHCNAGLDPSGNPIPMTTHTNFQSDPALAAQGVIDQTKIDPVAAAYISHSLIPSSASGLLTPNGGAYDNRDEYNLKLDDNATQKDHLTLTLDKSHNPTEYPFLPGFAPNVPGFPGLSQFNNYFGSLSYNRIFSPSTINEFHFTAQRNDNRLNYPGSIQPGPSDLGAAAIIPDQTTGPPQLLFNGGPQIGFNLNGPAHYADTTYMFSDTLTRIFGRHTLKAGGSFGIVQNNAFFAYAVNGQYYFFGGTTGNEYADFLLGAPDYFDQYPKGFSAIRSQQYGGFVQDEWRAASRLVLTLGLRYEYSTPKWDPQHRNYMIIPGKQSVKFPNAPLGLLFPGDPGAPSRGVNFQDRNDWAPRFGFAWDPLGNGKTSIRGGAGVFFDVLLAQDNQYQNGTPPFYSAGSFCSNPNSYCGIPPTDPGPGPYTFLSDPYVTAGVTNPFPSKPPTSNLDFGAAGFLPFGPASVFIDPHLRTPYLYQYNLNVQQQLGSGLVGEVGYVGSSAHKLVAEYDGNPFIAGTTDRPLNLQPGLQPQFSGCSSDPLECAYGQMPATFGNAANANYNGLLASLTKSIGNWHSMGNVFFTMSYTWSHVINYADGFVRNSNAVPANNHGLFRASGDSDIRHRFVLSGGWELPFAHAFQKAPKWLTSGWNLYPIFFAQTGVPMDVLEGLFIDGSPGPSGTGEQNLVRPDWAGGPPHMLNPGHVVLSPTGQPQHFAFDISGIQDLCSVRVCSGPTFGTLPRNFFRAPGRVNLDLSLEKRTRFNDRVEMVFRAEFFNILNHTEWQSPVASVPFVSPLLGQITSTFDPRIGQVALRFTF